MKLLILAGGMSSRMRKESSEDVSLDTKLIEQANTLPKCMIGLGKNGRPFLDYVLYNTAKAGIKEVILLLNPKDRVTQPYYEMLVKSGGNWGLDIRFARQYIPENREKPLGTSDAIEQALAQHPTWADDRFITCNGDNLYPVKAFRLLAEDPHPNAMLDWDSAGNTTERIRNCAIVMNDEDGFLTDLVEKPNDNEWKVILQTMPRIGISWNIFAFTGKDLVPFLKKTPLHPVRNEKEVPVTVRLWAKEIPKSIYTIPISEPLPDLTSKNDIAAIQAILESQYPDI